ncbi:MAG: sigma factor-like helix-turn-helix DNA-binding protein [Pseudomonadota bacterium]
MKDLEVTVRVRNNQLKGRRIALGLTQREFAAAADVDSNAYSGLESLRENPRRLKRDYSCRAPGCPSKTPRGFCIRHMAAPKDQRDAWAAAFVPEQIWVWTPTAERLAAFHQVPVEDLFPEAIQAIKSNVAISEWDVPEMVNALVAMEEERAGEDPDDRIIARQRSTAIEDMLSTLTPREEKIVRMRFGVGEKSDHTLEEVGEEFEVGSERIRQIEARAFRKMRHSSRSRWLKPMVLDGEAGLKADVALRARMIDVGAANKKSK